MILIERNKINYIPTLQVVKQSLKKQPLPTVVYYHGFNGEKESSLTIAYKIAEKGLRVILPDAPLHGERAITKGPVEHGQTFWNIVIQAVEEINMIKSYLQDRQYILEDKLGLGGTSMGGMITYAALCKYEWIKSAAVLMGTPYVTKRAQDSVDLSTQEGKELKKQIEQVDITKQLNKLKERPLLIWHGENDEIVPVEDSRKFYNTLTNDNQTENVQFIAEEERIHNISKLSIEKTAEWFDNRL